MASVSTFVDPSVEFGLSFKDDNQDQIPESKMVIIDEDDDEKKDAEIVSLDSFRKK